jgi:hypothetical protein
VAQSQHEGDMRIKGNLSCTTFTAPNGSIDNAAIEALAGIAANKLEHRYQPTFAQPNTTAAAETHAIHVVYGTTGEVIAFRAGSIAACIGDSTVTVDLKKNGTTMLSSVITLDSGNTARVVEAGTISGAGTLAAGDLLEIVIAVSAGTGTLATGVYVQAIINEDAE